MGVVVTNRREMEVAGQRRIADEVSRHSVCGHWSCVDCDVGMAKNEPNQVVVEEESTLGLGNMRMVE